MDNRQYIEWINRLLSCPDIQSARRIVGVTQERVDAMQEKILRARKIIQEATSIKEAERLLREANLIPQS